MRSLLLIPFTMLAACQNADSAVAPAGVAGTRDFPLSGFTGVDLRGADDVQVRRGTQFSVRAEGDEALLRELDIEVDGNTLKIGREKRLAGWTGGKARISVTLPALRSVSVAGSGDMDVDVAEADSFDGAVAGSGNLRIARLTSRSADFSVAGSGNVSVAGTVERLDMSLAGSGNIEAGKLQAADLEANIAGSGNINAAASDRAEISIIGSGDVHIAGNPKCEVNKMGSGNVRCGG